MGLERQFEPEIIAFTCHYCAYAAADLAGVMRLQYPTNIRIIKLPCSGAVDILHILKAFEQGIDGVFVAGCLEGGCHFTEGNIRARKRVEQAKHILDKVGLGGNRLEMFFMSSAEGPRFVEVAREMTQRIKDLGPNPIKGALYDRSQTETI
jgi:F420-non-reducing hydrogenase iron-sulfur subunit